MDGRINVRSIKGVGSEFTVDVKLGITEEESCVIIRNSIAIILIISVRLWWTMM